MQIPIKKIAIGATALFGTLVVLPAADVSAAAKVPTMAMFSHIEHQPPHQHFVASRESDQVQARVVVTKRRPHGRFMDVKFRIEFSSLPTGKKYKECFWDMGMKRDGYKPQCFGEPMSPDSDGQLQFHFETTDMSRGEWMQLSIRSTDGAIQKTVRFIPNK